MSGARHEQSASIQIDFVIAFEDLEASLAGMPKLSALWLHLFLVQQLGNEILDVRASVVWGSGAFVLSAKCQLCNPSLQNEMSPLAQESTTLLSLDSDRPSSLGAAFTRNRTSSH